MFYQMPMIEFFGRPENASINFMLNEMTRSWECNGKVWTSQSSKNRMNISGFYEGSIIFGNRFKDTNISTINKLDNLTKNDLEPAREFVYKNLGQILKNDEEFYKELFLVKKNSAKNIGLTREAFCIKKAGNQFISQPRMSTGENLLLSILQSLEYVRKRRKKNNEYPCIVFLDEIELALHSSALRRLVVFLKHIAEELELSIFFSTHSIDLLREIKAQNIFYLSSFWDNDIMVTNPCYPAYATRNLYGDDGYGNDMVILVEDDLAKLIIEKLLLEKQLVNNIRIKILPTGGWTNTITMAYDVTTSNLLQKGTKLAVVLDKDIKDEVPDFFSRHKQYSGIKVDFLPIASLEKYLYSKLVRDKDKKLFILLDTYLFQKRPLLDILNQYQKEVKAKDNDGKSLYGVLINEVKSMRKDRENLVEIIVKYIIENEKQSVEELSNYVINKVKA
ncbi:AAA domain protein [Lachnoanaerobaculum sp. MSX33]|nr:AAA domain protein [Lachnoanaerobaculum sp. MSX33]